MRTYGGPADDKALAITQARDGSFLMAGLTMSFGAGKSDVWLMKLSQDGREIWRRFLGSSDHDWANDLIETREGNFVVVGYSRDPREGHNNAWVFMVDPQGRVKWSRTFGGDKGDEARSVIQTLDGGLAIVGFSHSFGIGKSDIWLLKLDAEGNEQWQETYGGKEADRGNCLVETPEGDLILAGYTQSFGSGQADLLVLKVDAQGKGIWKENYGGKNNEAAESMALTRDGHLVLAGWTNSVRSGSTDGLVMELDGQGKKIWSRTFGGVHTDMFFDLTPSFDGHFYLAGASATESQNADLWLLKINRKGGNVWERFVEGEKNDYGYSIAETLDGGFIVAGGTNTYGEGGSDIWVVKADRQAYLQARPSTPAPITTPAVPPPPVAGEDFYKPNLYILAVGISRFQDHDINLNFADADALAIAEKFSEMEGKIFHQVHVKTLTNEDASLVNIKTAISWLEREATQKDLILMFISSHGALDNKGNLYILPNDFNAYNLFATGLNIKDLTEGTNATPCKKLILLDACHSGQSAFDLLEFATAKALDLNKVVKELMSKEPGVTVMTSSSGKEFSYENPRWGHGAFTKALLEALEGQADYNQNQVLNLSEMNLYVTERVKELTAGRQHPYTPINLFGDIPIFVFE